MVGKRMYTHIKRRMYKDGLSRSEQYSGYKILYDDDGHPGGRCLVCVWYMCVCKRERVKEKTRENILLYCL